MSTLQKVAIHGAPRSGTTWLGQLINSSPQVLFKFQPLFSYDFKDFLNAESSYSDIQDFYSKLANTNTEFLNQTKGIEKGFIPKFKKADFSHIVYKEVRYHHIIENLMQQDNTIKVLGIIRNPLAVINSWLNSPREFRADLGWDPLAEWYHANLKNENKPEEFYGFEKWKQVAQLFEKLSAQYPENFKIVEYNTLLHHPLQEVEAMYKFLGLEVTEQTVEFVEKSREKNVADTYSVFNSKATDNSYEQQLNPVIAAAIRMALENTALEKYLES